MSDQAASSKKKAEAPKHVLSLNEKISERIVAEGRADPDAKPTTPPPPDLWSADDQPDPDMETYKHDLLPGYLFVFPIASVAPIEDVRYNPRKIESMVEDASNLGRASVIYATYRPNDAVYNPLYRGRQVQRYPVAVIAPACDHLAEGSARPPYYYRDTRPLGK